MEPERRSQVVVVLTSRKGSPFRISVCGEGDVAEMLANSPAAFPRGSAAEKKEGLMNSGQLISRTAQAILQLKLLLDPFGEKYLNERLIRHIALIS